MRTVNRCTGRILLTLVACLLIAPCGLWAQVPAELPAHDGKPGDMTKPVQVYILAGQSNMVGMGEISGAKNLYDAIYLTSDPDASIGPMTVWKVGNYKILPLKLYDAAGNPTQEVGQTGSIRVPLHGVYEFYFPDAMSQRSTVLMLDGKPVLTRGDDGEAVRTPFKLKAGRNYTYSAALLNSDGIANPGRFFLKKTDMLGNGDLEAVVKREGMFPWVATPLGSWIERQDVAYRDPRIRPDGQGSLLSPTSNNGKTIGPELGFGHVMGTYHAAQVLLIKTAMGNRSLGFDFRPPSSGRTDPDSEWESLEYKLMVQGVNKTLANIEQVVPGYRGQGYEIAGFAWWQGHKDGGSAQAEYEKHLVNLIRDVRKDFNAPQLPVVIATVGFNGNAMDEKYTEILNAQMAVADPVKHPAFAGRVATIDTRGYWRETDESPKGEGHHYNRNAETYYRVGDALGRAMVALKGGDVEPLTNPNVHVPSPAPQSTAYTKTQSNALAPIIMNSIAIDYATNPRYRKALLEELNGERPQRESQFLNGPMYGLVNAYNAAGIDTYDWKPFGPDLNEAAWQYHSFDPAEAPKGDGARFRAVAWPDAMAGWTDPSFNPAEHGWKTGQQPFGTSAGERKALREGCESKICGCGITPQTLWEKEVLMARTTIQVPPLKDGHRYRLIVGGAAHVNSGEGYALYVDGQLVHQSTVGVGKRQGGQPRGGHLYTDVIDQLKDGKATIAIYSFQRFAGGGGPFPNGHLSVHLEQQKLPPIRAEIEAAIEEAQ